MARLIPNPVGDIGDHLVKVEQAIKDLSDDLEGVKNLPAILSELQKLNKSNAAIVKALDGVRQDLARPR